MSIEINLNDHVATITFNDKQEVFSVETSNQLSAVVEELEQSSRVDVVILEHPENAGGKWAALNSVQIPRGRLLRQDPHSFAGGTTP